MEKDLNQLVEKLTKTYGDVVAVGRRGERRLGRRLRAHDGRVAAARPQRTGQHPAACRDRPGPPRPAVLRVVPAAGGTRAPHAHPARHRDPRHQPERRGGREREGDPAGRAHRGRGIRRVSWSVSYAFSVSVCTRVPPRRCSFLTTSFHQSWLSCTAVRISRR